MIERQIISVPEEKEIIKFAFLSTPNFVTTEGETLTKVIICLLKDATFTIHSSISGHFIDHLDLKNFTDIDTSKDQIVDMQTTSAGNEFSLNILTSNGFIHIINFDFKRLELVREQPQNLEGESANKTNARPLRFPKSIMISSAASFNIWTATVNTNSTVYEEEIKSLLAEGIKPISLEYYGRPLVGNFIVADSKGYFSIFKKATPHSRAPANSTQANEWTLFKRVHSGLDSIKIIRRLGALIVFASETNIGFLRAYDGDLATSQCEVGTSKIVALDLDKENNSRFFVGTDEGEIVAYATRFQERGEIT